jgi:molecular chaperone GrpE
MAAPQEQQPNDSSAAERAPAAEEQTQQQTQQQTQDSELDELRDRWQRAAAELDNVRKRADRQIVEQREGERRRVAAAWLPVLDNLDLALRHADADPLAIVTGVAAVRDQAQSVLERLGFTPVEDVGRPFDPQRHEAAEVVDDTDLPAGTIVAVLRPGYATGSTLVRPAIVAVAGKRD